MRKSIFFSTVAAVLCILLASCDANNGKTFSNKTDSMAFARAVMQQYPETRNRENILSDTIIPPAAIQKPGTGFSPIGWATVEDYSNRYDADPGLKSPEGFFYQGFSIDTAGYNRLIRTKSIKGLYLRLGRKPNEDYTIMILGTDADGKIINTSETLRLPGDSTNFDDIHGCPRICPN